MDQFLEGLSDHLVRELNERVDVSSRALSTTPNPAEVTRIGAWLCRRGWHRWADRRHWVSKHRSSFYGVPQLFGQECERCLARRYFWRPGNGPIPMPDDPISGLATDWVLSRALSTTPNPAEVTRIGVLIIHLALISICAGLLAILQ